MLASLDLWVLFATGRVPLSCSDATPLPETLRGSALVLPYKPMPGERRAFADARRHAADDNMIEALSVLVLVVCVGVLLRVLALAFDE
jgi:hypothetical protein